MTTTPRLEDRAIGQKPTCIIKHDGSIERCQFNHDFPGYCELGCTSEAIIEDGWPAWSPDGTLIAFASNRGGTGDYEIYVMKPDGSDVRRVARTIGRATAPKWGRDGRTVYFPICYRGGCEIYESRI